MMTYLWVYSGTLEGNKLTLEVEGPAFDGPGTALFRDIIEFKTDDHRLLSSHVRTADGKWQQFQTTEYRRVT
jgi:hypothetical protein